jgi:acyl carrier protein
MKFREEVRQFILSNFLFTDDQARLADGESLLQSGAVDSTGILELIMFIQERYGFTVEDHEMLPANLDSVANICAFVKRKVA